MIGSSKLEKYRICSLVSVLRPTRLFLRALHLCLLSTGMRHQPILRHMERMAQAHLHIPPDLLQSHTLPRQPRLMVEVHLLNRIITLPPIQPLRRPQRVIQRPMDLGFLPKYWPYYRLIMSRLHPCNKVRDILPDPLHNY